MGDGVSDAATRAGAWRAAVKAAVELPLPSGVVILARRPDLMQLAAWNKLPLYLAGAVAPGTGEEPDVAEAMKATRELLEYCCVEPRISLEPTPEEIHPRDIPEGDWTFIVRWALRLEEARKLEPFRTERRDDGGGGDSDGLRAAAVGIVGDR